MNVRTMMAHHGPNRPWCAEKNGSFYTKLLKITKGVLILFGPQCISHTHTIVRECCKGDDQSQWRRANFDPPSPLNPLTDIHQNVHRWLLRGYLPPCKILFRSDEGFRFRACATSRTNFYSAIFWGSNNHIAKTPPRTSTQNTSKDAVLRKDVPFGGRKTKI